MTHPVHCAPVTPARSRPFRRTALALAALLAPAACEAPRSKGVVDRRGEHAGEPLAPFAPVSARIHPLTRWREDDSGRSLLEARFELLDRYGLEVRSLGAATFTLSRAGGPEVRWELDLTDPDRNARENYDPVTRLYVAPLALTQGMAPEPGATLRLVFVTPDERSLSAEFRVERRRAEAPAASRP